MAMAIGRGEYVLENYHIYTNKVKYIGYYEDIYRVISIA